MVATIMFSGYEWLAGRLESSGYEEYSGTEFRSAGCTEEYKISKWVSFVLFHYTKVGVLCPLPPVGVCTAGVSIVYWHDRIHLKLVGVWVLDAFVIVCPKPLNPKSNFKLGSVFSARREMSQMEGQDALCLEGDISGGLALFREIILPQNSPDTVQISSKIVAKSVGAGSGGFSR